MMEVPVIEIRNLKVVYNENTSSEVVALDKFSLTVKRGEILVITGGNGTGKSTLLNAIAGTIPVKSGEILFNGININKQSAVKRARSLGMIHQDTMLGTCPNLSLQENFQLVNRKPWWLPVPYESKFTEKQLNDIRQTGLPLESRSSAKINTFSGGQRQALTICLAFAVEKQVLLLDEFTSALDEHTKSKILTYTFEQARIRNTTLLMVMHDVTSVALFTNNIITF